MWTLSVRPTAPLIGAGTWNGSRGGSVWGWAPQEAQLPSTLQLLDEREL